MKSGKPALRKPPEAREMDPALANLLKVDAWTQQPAEKASADAGIGQAEEGTVAQMVETLEPEQQAAPAREVAVKQGSQVMPWEHMLDVPRPEVVRPKRTVNNAVPRQSTTYRLPLPLVQALHWLGETTYGENVTSIVVQALEDEVNARLAAAGKPPIQRATPDRKLRKLPKP